MASENTTKRVVQRAIPRLKKGTTFGKSTKSDSKLKEEDKPSGRGSSRQLATSVSVTSASKMASNNDQGKENTKSDEHISKAGTVINSKRVEETKRKRHQSPAVLEIKDPATKRNPAREQRREKNKCQVEFSTKANTKFTDTQSCEAKFTAKGPLPSSSKGRSYNFTHLRRMETELRARLDEAETQLKVADKEKREAVSQLQKKIDDLKGQIEKLEEEKEMLMNEKHEAESSYLETLEDQEKNFIVKIDNLQNKVDECQKKLQDCHIDPVTLKTVELTEEEKENLAVKVKTAADKASELKVKAQEVISKNKECEEKLKNILSGQPSKEATGTQSE